MKKRVEKNKLIVILKSIKKHLKIRHLILLIVLFSVNTYAWFIYSQKLNGNFDVHVRSWKIMFSSSDHIVSNNIVIKVSNMYPGMEMFKDTIVVYNDSEVYSKIYYNILEVNIMGTTYMSREGKIKKGLEPNDDDMSSQELESMLEEQYPFKIKIGTTMDVMSPDDQESNFNVTVDWPFEQGDDEADTYWGTLAYDYMKKNNTTTCIDIKLDLIVEQITNNENSQSSGE